MTPTGVPMLDVRKQLFDAAMRVLLREGADALTSRAVTTEAGVAKGILHRHFPDFNAFLASLVLAHVELLDARSAELRTSAGTGTVLENLADALAGALTSDVLVLIGLVLSRQGLLNRLRITTPSGIPLLVEATRMIATYLTAERGLGRLAIETDVDQLALILVGSTYLLRAGGDAAGGDAARSSRDELRKLVATVIVGTTREPRKSTSCGGPS